MRFSRLKRRLDLVVDHRRSVTHHKKALVSTSGRDAKHGAHDSRGLYALPIIAEADSGVVQAAQTIHGASPRKRNAGERATVCVHQPALEVEDRISKGIGEIYEPDATVADGEAPGIVHLARAGAVAPDRPEVRAVFVKDPDLLIVKVQHVDTSDAVGVNRPNLAEHVRVFTLGSADTKLQVCREAAAVLALLRGHLNGVASAGWEIGRVRTRGCRRQQGREPG